MTTTSKRKPAKKRKPATKRRGRSSGDKKPPTAATTTAAPADDDDDQAKRRADQAEAHRRQAADRQARLSEERREIGAIPPVANKRRRKAAEGSLRKFCETYFAGRFYLKWSPDHLRVLDIMERCARDRGLFALAMPRGSGKTSLAECAAIWAALCGFHEYVALFGATQTAGVKRMANIKTSLLCNEKLAADFPEICYPIRALDDVANRAAGQMCEGKKTRITWGRSKVVFPTIEGAAGSGAVIECGGLLSAVRGLVETRPDGKQARPTLAIIDDPQTRRSARSAGQTDQRERIIAGDVLYLPGGDQKISAVMPCTVIEADDLAARFLDRKRNPEWQAIHGKALYAFPTDLRAWDQYAEILHDELVNGGDGKQATDFYRKNRKAMDKGAKPAWKERFFEGELSAVQFCMNLHIRDAESFAAEMQNEPIENDDGRIETLEADEIARKISGYNRGEYPVECDLITAFVDVQKELLYWAAVAWSDRFTGYVVDYGSYPDQEVSYFTAAGVRKKLSRTYPGLGFEGRLFKALTDLTDELDRREWIRDDGASLKIELGLIDANWGESTDTVYSWARQRARVWMPSHGRYIGASHKPISEYERKRGERIGFNWVMPALKGRKRARYVWYDSNAWKSFIQARLATELGDAGSVSLFNARPGKHRLLADHLTAEYGVETSGRGRTVTEWRLRPNRPDNHWLDCLAGCCVAASMRGKTIDQAIAGRVNTEQTPRRRRRRVSYL